MIFFQQVRKNTIRRWICQYLIQPAAGVTTRVHDMGGMIIRLAHQLKKDE